MERESQKDFREIQGEWTREQVEALSHSMLAEPEFEKTVFAGNLLLKNQRGEPSFSTVTPFFADTRVKIVTAADLTPSTFFRPDLIDLMEAQIQEIGPVKEIALSPREEAPVMPISARSKLQLNVINIVGRQLSGVSDFAFKFFVAKEIYTVLTFNDITAICINEFFSGKYHIPDSDDERNVLRTYCLHSELNGVPPAALADILAHFMMLPDFMLAQDKGKFDGTNKGFLAIFEAAVERFVGEGALLKNQDGRYEWTQDIDKFYGSWLAAGIQLGQILRGRI